MHGVSPWFWKYRLDDYRALMPVNLGGSNIPEIVLA